MKKVTAIINREKCHPKLCRHECMTYDPINRSGGEGFHLAEHGKAEIDEALVTEMHKVSAKMCPFDAIKIVKLPEALEKEPIHGYGMNQFRLFSLPTPIFGKVVGVLGINGIGKSTAIKVLAGVLKPNLGKDREATHKEMIEYFKGTEAQLFFERLDKGEITVSYKPQQVDLIPKTQKGKVGPLLKKVDEKGKLDEISKELEIDMILDRDIKDISGGELQRVAIAAAVLKKANLYIFDEPTSYLDVRQRVKVSRFIKKLADEDTSVLVVEHDLIILDYIADLVHVMYGEEDAYGIVAQPRATRTAINTYLSGLLKEENIRFRDHAITFEPVLVSQKKSEEAIVDWEDVEKTLGTFHLKTNTGSLFQQEVVGILGENGIGKTSFMRILAGEIKADTGQLAEKIKISYKPQYLQSESEEVVSVVLKDAKKYKSQILTPLNIEPLMEKQLNQLSGGELQRVSIALCFSRDADLYLLDEPSAYLDVEQRLIISKVIRNFMEKRGKAALIVDHDLMFIDHISQRLMVFTGIPAQKGAAEGPFSKEEGMNIFLQDLNITFRKDPESHRSRINKEDSVKDREQKAARKYYYV